MRRAAAIFAGWICALLLLLFSHGAGSIARPPQITYGGITGALFGYDVASDLSVPMVRGIEKLPVAWSWSPDGLRLAFVLLDYGSGTYDVRLWTPHLRLESEIVGGLPFGAPPQWSPDSQTIAAIDSHQDICVYAFSGAAPACLNVQPAGQPTWSPDGKAIAYLSRLTDGGLMRVELADGHVTPLFTGVSGLNYPTWSPDGKFVAFSYQEDFSGLRHIYAVPSAGGALRALTGGETWQEGPVWSPDSAYVAYNEHPTSAMSQPDIAVVNVETGEVTRVTTHPLIDTDPRWSPDGRYLAFVSDRFDGKPRLHIVSTANLDAVEPLALPGIVMRLYAYAWRP